MKKHLPSILLFLPLVAVANPFSPAGEREKLQYLADLTKQEPHIGAVAYQLDSYYRLECDNSATLAQLKALMQTKSVQSLVVLRDKNNVIGLQKLASTFESFDEQPHCKG